MQELFIQIHKIRKQFRLKTSEKQIIWWITKNINPPKVRAAIQNIQKQDSHKGRAASKRLPRRQRTGGSPNIWPICNRKD